MKINSLVIKFRSYHLPVVSKHLLSNLLTINSVPITILLYNFWLAFNPNICQFYFYISAKNGIISHLEFSIFFASAWSWLVLMPQVIVCQMQTLKNQFLTKNINFLKNKYQFLSKNINFWNNNQFGFCFCFVSPRIPLSSLKLWAHAVQPAIRNIFTKQDVILNRDNNSRLA